MAEWVTHLMVADKVLERMPMLCRHEFCVGNIAPDCNVANADWTEFTPSREVTHWMKNERKTASDCLAFYSEYIEKRMDDIHSKGELSFLLGYYSHLVTDAELQRTIRDPERVKNSWVRIKSNAVLAERARGMREDWDSVKQLINREERMKDFFVIEREYLDTHPNSGYYTEIADLKTFPDYIDYLPKNAIVNKIKIMYYIPSNEQNQFPNVAFSRQEYIDFIKRAVDIVVGTFEEIVENTLIHM